MSWRKERETETKRLKVERYVHVRKRTKVQFTSVLSPVNILDVRMTGLLTIWSPHQTQLSVCSAPVHFAHAQTGRVGSHPSSTLWHELTKEHQCPVASSLHSYKWDTSLEMQTLFFCKWWKLKILETYLNLNVYILGFHWNNLKSHNLSYKNSLCWKSRTSHCVNHGYISLLMYCNHRWKCLF